MVRLLSHVMNSHPQPFMKIRVKKIYLSLHCCFEAHGLSDHPHENLASHDNGCFPELSGASRSPENSSSKDW